MEGLLTLGVLLLLAVPVSLWLGVSGWFKARRALAELSALRGALAAAGFSVPGGAVPYAVPVPPVPDAPPPALDPAAFESAVPELPAAPLPATAPAPSFEERLTQRWGVWLGAVALLLSGVFLVRYAAEQGLLGPAARCGAAAVLGLALVLVAEWLRRRPTAERPGLPWPDQAPAALAAGGAAVLFGAAYGTAVLYALVPPLLGFGLLAAAALAALALALLHGPLAAAVGIVGAYATPALVETPDPSLPGLFAYLLVVTGAALAVVRQVGVAWLGWAATIAAATWVMVGGLLAGDTAGLWAPALFVPAAAALHLALLPGAALETPLGRRLAWVPVAALAAAGLLLVPGTKGLAPAAGLLLLTPVTVWAGVREPRLDRMPWLAAFAGLLLLLVWAVPEWQPTGEAVTVEGVVAAILPTGAWAPEALHPFLAAAALLAAMHALAGLWQEARAPHPLRWAALPAAVPVLALLVAYARVRGFAPDMGWAFAALGLAALLVGTATRAARDGTAEGRQRAGAHAAGAVAALALGAAAVLSEYWLTLAVALLLPPLAWIEARAELPALRQVALGVAAFVLVRLFLNGTVLDYAFGPVPVLNGVLAAYGVPAASFALAAALFRRRGDDAAVGVLEAGATAFLGALALLLIRHAVTGGDLKAEDWSFREGALDVLALAMLAANLRWLDRRLGGRPVLAWAWRLFQAAAALLGTGLVLRNPAWDVGAGLLPYPVLNELLLGYGLPAALAMAAVRALAAPLPRRALGAYALLAAFAWVTLEVRHYFHPVEMSLALEEVGSAELWSYSGAWLVFGAVLLALGIRQGWKALRLAALAVLGLTVGKVFLVDMAALEGLWRVLSFLGLGLALIALGRVYRRYVVAPGPAATPPPASETTPPPAPATPA